MRRYCSLFKINPSEFESHICSHNKLQTIISVVLLPFKISYYCIEIHAMISYTCMTQNSCGNFIDLLGIDWNPSS